MYGRIISYYSEHLFKDFKNRTFLFFWWVGGCGEAVLDFLRAKKNNPPCVSGNWWGTQYDWRPQGLCGDTAEVSGLKATDVTLHPSPKGFVHSDLAACLGEVKTFMSDEQLRAYLSWAGTGTVAGYIHSGLDREPKCMRGTLSYYPDTYKTIKKYIFGFLLIFGFTYSYSAIFHNELCQKYTTPTPPRRQLTVLRKDESDFLEPWLAETWRRISG